MSAFRRSLFALAALSTTTLLCPAAARADDTISADQSKFRPFTLELNPLAAILLRFSVNFEYLPVPHHALVISPYFGYASQNAGSAGAGVAIKETYTSYGGELGYHFWSGDRGANGFFVGPSLIISHTGVSLDCSGSSSGSCSSGSSFNYYGAAVDLGGQHIFDGGFTIGGGFGLMYLKTSTSVDNTPSTLKVSGVLPRFLFSIGYSF